MPAAGAAGLDPLDDPFVLALEVLDPPANCIAPVGGEVLAVVSLAGLGALLGFQLGEAYERQTDQGLGIEAIEDLLAGEGLIQCEYQQFIFAGDADRPGGRQGELRPGVEPLGVSHGQPGAAGDAFHRSHHIMVREEPQIALERPSDGPSVRQCHCPFFTCLQPQVACFLRRPRWPAFGFLSRVVPFTPAGVQVLRRTSPGGSFS